MNQTAQSLLDIISGGKGEAIWEAAKQLECLTSNIALSLIKFLQTGETSDGRAAAAYVLGFARFASARTALEGALSNASEAPLVRGHAAEALGYIGDKESLPTLVGNLGGDPGVTYWCIFSLGQIGDPRAIPALRRIAETAAEQRYEDFSLREEALNALSEIENRAKSGKSSGGDRA